MAVLNHEVHVFGSMAEVAEHKAQNLWINDTSTHNLGKYINYLCCSVDWTHYAWTNFLYSFDLFSVRCKLSIMQTTQKEMYEQWEQLDALLRFFRPDC